MIILNFLDKSGKTNIISEIFEIYTLKDYKNKHRVLVKNEYKKHFGWEIATFDTQKEANYFIDVIFDKIEMEKYRNNIIINIEEIINERD